jgi:hypothetical protein
LRTQEGFRLRWSSSARSWREPHRVADTTVALVMADSETRDPRGLREWCLAIYEFASSVVWPSARFDLEIDAIERAFQAADSRGLEAVARDLEEWARGFKAEHRERLDAFLRSRFGRGLKEATLGTERQINRILKRGVIENQDEYRLLSQRAAEIGTEASKRNELARIDRLLSAFTDED